jgi:hypothetical protein
MEFLIYLVFVMTKISNVAILLSVVSICVIAICSYLAFFIFDTTYYSDDKKKCISIIKKSTIVFLL